MVLHALVALLLTAVGTAAMSADLSVAGRPETQPLRWRTGVIRLAVSSSLTTQNGAIKSDSDILGALRRSISAWETATGLQFRIESSERQNVSPSGAAGDGVSLISIAATPENLQLFAKDPFGESARTRIFYNRRGSITEGDIILNPLQQFSSDGTYGTFDLETVFTHEIGHLLGLKHSSVSGSVMAERIGRNSDQFAGPRTITAADLASIRDLYNVESDTCCGVVTGRLTGLGKNTRNVTVWLEDGDSRVAAQAEVAADGTYRLGGLPEGKFQAFWKSPYAFGELGSVTVSTEAPTALSKRITADKGDFSLEVIGLNMQPGDSAVSLRAGRQYWLCLGGSGFGPGVANVYFSSDKIRTEASPVARPDFGEKLDATAFSVIVDPDTPTGMYSLYAERRDGAKAVLVGAILVTK